jgi:hypothetical protein
MKKTALLFCLYFTITAFCSKDAAVYICGPQGAKKYHYSENCRGLSACKHEVFKVTKSKAESYGLTLCGWED